MTEFVPVFQAADERPYVLAFANEKGGTGKSTLAFHAIVALLREGFAVGSIDTDLRQATLSRYIANRTGTAMRGAGALALPEHIRLQLPDADLDRDFAAALPALRTAFESLLACDFIVVDTPGSAGPLTRAAILNADTLVSPINDSYVDIDVLASLDLGRREVTGPSVFTRLVWDCSNRRAAAGLAPTDWIVLRNRLTHIESRNKRDIADLMEKLSRRIGFRVASGFGERVVYRELFHEGLTAMDRQPDDALPATPSRDAARTEMAALLGAIGIAADPARAT